MPFTAQLFDVVKRQWIVAEFDPQTPHYRKILRTLDDSPEPDLPIFDHFDDTGAPVVKPSPNRIREIELGILGMNRP